jgi:CheY-like chemotaxis protein
MDVDLPGMSGYELARKLRTEHAAEPMLLVALTGYCQDEDRQRAFRAGFHVHVAKPAPLDELERVLAVEPEHTSRFRSMDRTTFAAASV